MVYLSPLIIEFVNRDKGDAKDDVLGFIVGFEGPALALNKALAGRGPQVDIGVIQNIGGVEKTEWLAGWRTTAISAHIDGDGLLTLRTLL